MQNKAQKLKSGFCRLWQYVVKRDLLLAVAVAVSVIVVGVYLGYLNNQVVPVSTSTTARSMLEPANPLRFMSNWDGPDYLQIAHSGYSTSAQTNYFPLYPLAVHAVNTVISSELDSALLISWVCFAGAIYFYLKILKRLFNIYDNLTALKGVLLFVLFPTGVFLLASYTESMFALFALGAVYFALKKRFLPAALLTLLATATHINGLFVLFLVAAILIEEHEKITKILATLVIGSLGIVGYMIYLQVRFNSAIAFITAQQKHGWLATGYFNHLSSTINIFSVLAIVLLVISVIYWWNRRKSFSLYSFLYLCIPLLGGQFGGFNRYVLMAFPVQFMLYDHFRSSKNMYPVILAATSVLWCYFLLQYAGGYIGG